MAQGTTRGVPIDIDPLLAADSDLLVPSQKAVKTYIDNSNVNQVTSVTGTSPIASSGGTTPVISILQASGSVNGYLSSADFTTFSNKQNALTNPVTGTGTNNEIAYFNTTGSTIGSLSTATYPSLTELSYVKGVTSAIQTQINSKGYAINLGAQSTNINASTTYYFGVPQLTVTGTTAIRRVYIPQTGTIIGGQIYARATSATSTQTWTLSIRLNNTTNTTFASTANNSLDKVFSATGLSIAVVAGDYIEITTTTPAWSVSPGATFIYGSIFIQ